MMSKRKLTKSEVYAVAFLLFLLCFFAYVKFIYDPARKELEQLYTTISQTQSELDRLGDPPDTKKAQNQLKKANEDLKSLTDELEYYQETKKANQQPQITEVMAVINSLAVKNGLSVKQIKFIERIYEIGSNEAADAKKKTVQKGKKTSSRKQKQPTVITVSQYFPWDRYTIKITGSQDGIVNFTGDLSKTFWLVHVDKLQISAGGDKKKKDSAKNTGETQEQKANEFEMTLEISL